MFDDAYVHLDLVEGGKLWTDNPADSGGETYGGVARRRWPNWEGWALIDQYKREPNFPDNIDHDRLMPLRRNFFRKEFWDSNRLDDVAAVSEAIAHEVFDTCINTGVRGQFLQRELNALNRQRRDYPDIEVDGDIGPATLSALRSYLVIRGKEGEAVMLHGLNAQLHQRYLELVESRQKDEAFFYGWVLQRVVRPAVEAA